MEWVSFQGRLDNCNHFRFRRNWDAEHWIKKFSMTELPEGGLFSQTFCSEQKVSHLPKRYGRHATRSVSSHIYYLLREHEISALHILKSDETWHWYFGKEISMYIIDKDTGHLRIEQLGPECGDFATTITAGDIYGAKITNPIPGSYALLGNTVAPGFEFVDFKLAERKHLLKQYPQYGDVIMQLTRGETENSE